MGCMSHGQMGNPGPSHNSSAARAIARGPKSGGVHVKMHQETTAGMRVEPCLVTAAPSPTRAGAAPAARRSRCFGVARLSTSYKPSRKPISEQKRHAAVSH